MDERDHPDVQPEAWLTNVTVFNGLDKDTRVRLNLEQEEIKTELRGQGIVLETRRSLALVLRRHGYIPELKSSPILDDTEYNDIIAGDQIWASIQTNSGK